MANGAVNTTALLFSSTVTLLLVWPLLNFGASLTLVNTGVALTEAEVRPTKLLAFKSKDGAVSLPSCVNWIRLACMSAKVKLVNISTEPVLEKYPPTTLLTLILTSAAELSAEYTASISCVSTTDMPSVTSNCGVPICGGLLVTTSTTLLTVTVCGLLSVTKISNLGEATLLSKDSVIFPSFTSCSVKLFCAAPSFLNVTPRRLDTVMLSKPGDVSTSMIFKIALVNASS